MLVPAYPENHTLAKASNRGLILSVDLKADAKILTAPISRAREAVTVAVFFVFNRRILVGPLRMVGQTEFREINSLGLPEDRLCCEILPRWRQGKMRRGNGRMDFPPRWMEQDSSRRIVECDATELFVNGSAEMKCRMLTLLCVTMFAIGASWVAAAEPSPEDLLNGAMTTWRSGDAVSARDQLTAIINGGYRDPRVFYYRGLLIEQLGGQGNDDFKRAADLEAALSAGTRVNRALEKIQGPQRARIERFRLEARNSMKADPESARLKMVYREALNARREGDRATALSKFEELTGTGRDPRYFYMHGVTLAEMGELELARKAFSEGLKLEQTPDDVELVNAALADVQGEVRRLIEEETLIEVGDQLITRQQNRRDVIRRSAMTQEELLAESSTAGTTAEQRAEAEREARRLAAANQILAETRAREELEAKISRNVPVPEKPKVPVAPKPEVPKATVDTPVTQPPVPSQTTSANPFLSGVASAPPAVRTAASSITPGPIDMSYLPAATEYLMYVRPADMMNSGFVKPLTDMPQVQAGLAQMSAQFGYGPSEIESVTMGMSNVMATLLPVIAQAGSGAPPDPAALTQKLIGGQNAITVVRTVADVDFSGLIQAAHGSEATYEGKTYHLLQNPDPQQPQMAVYAIDGRTCIFASEPGIKSVISRGAGAATNDAFEFVSRSSHMVQAFSSPLLAGMSAGIPDPPQGVPPQVAQLLAAIKGNITGGAVVLEAGSNLKLNINLNLTDPSAATEANKALTGGLALVKQASPLFLGNAPPELQPTLTQAVNSLSSSSSQTVVSLSLSVPGSLVQVLKDNPQLLGPIFAAQQAADNVRQRNNLKQIALAMHNFHDTYNHFPAADGNGETGPGKKTGLSWRVHILPFLENAALYQQFHLDEPWDSDHNKTLIPFMPDVFKVPGVETPGLTSVHVFAAPNTPFDPQKPIGFRDITDGASYTIMAVEAGPETAKPWTEPGGLPFNSENPGTALGTLAQTFNIILMDGSVRSISSGIAPQTLSHLIQHNDGNLVNF